MYIERNFIMAFKRGHSDYDDVEDIKKFIPADLEEEDISSECQPQFRNYQLVGDLVSISILHSKNPLSSVIPHRDVISYNFTHAYWNSDDLRRALKTDKKTPIAKNVILSIGYKDCWEKNIGKHTLVKNIEKIVKKLQKKGCKELMITNIPPCAKVCDQIDYWKNLQFVNEEITKICSKDEGTFLCNIFDIFCCPKNLGDMLRKEKIDYVSFGDVNYKIHLELYNKEYRRKTDFVTFSAVGKMKLNERIENAIRLRRIMLRNKVRNVISTIELEDDSDDDREQKIKKSSSIKADTESDNDVIIIDDNDKSGCDINNIIVIDENDSTEASPKDTNDNKNNGHSILCECEDCERNNDILLGDILNEIKEEDKTSDEAETEAVTSDIKQTFPEKISVSCEVIAKIKEEEHQDDLKNLLLTDVKPELLNEMPIELLTEVKKKLEEELKVEKERLGVVKQENVSLHNCTEDFDGKKAKEHNTYEKALRKTNLKEENIEIKLEEVILDETTDAKFVDDEAKKDDF